jgi:hypothetical protein
MKQQPFKTVWIFSTEAWGIQRLSKHYYALELCNFADEVFFFNPFGYSFLSTIQIDAATENKKLKIVSTSFFNKGKRFIPESIRITLLSMKARWLMRKTGSRPDAVFSFNHLDILSLKPFKAKYNTFLLYDAFLKHELLPNIGYTANLMVTITPTIANVLAKYNKPVLLLQHGLNADFVAYAKRQFSGGLAAKQSPTNALFVGSLFKGTLDRVSFKAIIEQHPEITFHFFGSYEAKNNNLGGSEDGIVHDFISFLQSSRNVVLYGPKLAKEIVARLDEIDCCLHMETYSTAKVDVTNAHKLNEYLATGKPVFSSKVDAYVSFKELFFIAGTDAVKSFEDFLAAYNDQANNEKAKQRIAYSLEHTYAKNTERIIDKLLAIAL